MKVGIVEPVGGHGGMDYYDYGLSMGLGENEVDVFFYTCDKTKVRNYKNVTTKIFFKSLWNNSLIFKIFKYIIGHYWAYCDIIKNNGKIVHLHFFEFRRLEYFILFLAKFKGLKIIATIHDINGLDKKSKERIVLKCYSLMDKIIVHNDFSLKLLKEKLTFDKSITVIPHGNYLPFITPTPAKDNSSTFTLLFFGQIKKVKGLEILLEAMVEVKKQNNKITLIVAGRPWRHDLIELEELIRKTDLQDQLITDFRYIPDEEVADFYNKADIVVLPYKEIYQSGVLLLSMSYGKPVLCSDLEPFTEIIQNEKTGFLFQNGNAKDLATKIIFIYNNRKKLNDVSISSNALIREKFDWIKVGRITKEVYAGVI